jgi:Poxvirus A32 protein
METTDYSTEFTTTNHNVGHAPFFPKNIFCVIAGSTGCGKTNLLLNFLLKESILNYSDVYVYTSTLYQPAYQYLKEFYNNLENKIKKAYRKEVKIGNFFDADDEIKNPSELDPTTNHIMIFDDVMLKDQTKIKEYFCTGRHSNVNVFYLCQSLHKIAKHCIRDNANTFILFHQDDRALKYFHGTNISGDMDFKEFKQFCDSSWTKKHGYVVINLWEEAYCGRYIANYDVIYVPTKYLKILKNT